MENQSPRSPLQLAGTATTCLCGQTLAAAAEILQLPVLQKPQCSQLCYSKHWSNPRCSFSPCCIPRADSGSRSSAQGWIFPRWCQSWVPSWSCALLRVSTRRLLSSGAAHGRGDTAGERPSTRMQSHSQTPGTAWLGLRGDFLQKGVTVGLSGAMRTRTEPPRALPGTGTL